jgi:hypothetical protein
VEVESARYSILVHQLRVTANDVAIFNYNDENHHIKESENKLFIRLGIIYKSAKATLIYQETERRTKRWRIFECNCQQEPLRLL